MRDVTRYPRGPRSQFLTAQQVLTHRRVAGLYVRHLRAAIRHLQQHPEDVMDAAQIDRLTELWRTWRAEVGRWTAA